jgi:hypothetical protein
LCYRSREHSYRAKFPLKKLPFAKVLPWNKQLRFFGNLRLRLLTSSDVLTKMHERVLDSSDACETSIATSLLGLFSSYLPMIPSKRPSLVRSPWISLPYHPNHPIHIESCTSAVHNPRHLPRTITTTIYPTSPILHKIGNPTTYSPRFVVTHGRNTSWKCQDSTSGNCLDKIEGCGVDLLASSNGFILVGVCGKIS